MLEEMLSRKIVAIEQSLGDKCLPLCKLLVSPTSNAEQSIIQTVYFTYHQFYQTSNF